MTPPPRFSNITPKCLLCGKSATTTRVVDTVDPGGKFDGEPCDTSLCATCAAELDAERAAEGGELQ